MASFRFCRTDDVPLLVEAYNACYRVHFPGLPPMTVDRFKQAARDIDLWASSCMVAEVDARPVAVLLATKRDAETLILALGVHPDHRRQGFGRHLLTSLSAKLAILGPPKILAEVPASLEGAHAFLEACGFVREREYTDWVLATPEPAGEPPEIVIPVTLEELVSNGSLKAGARRPWERSHETLLKLGDSLAGLAIASSERIEAFLLAREDANSGRRILALGSEDPAKRELWLGLLLRQYAGSDDRPVRMDRVLPQEVPEGLLRSCGFEPSGKTLGFGATPVPG